MRLVIVFCLLSVATFRLDATSAEALRRDAQAAETAGDIRRALELYLAAEKAGPADAPLLQKIARQYSDLTLEQRSREEQRDSARRAIQYSQRAIDLAPRDAVNVLSLAISYGKLALASDTRDKVRYSRLVREGAERALALDPAYAWAHHVLGRWHNEVAALGRVSRTVVQLFYGGLPDATTTEAVRHLERAVQLEPDELQHHLELGFACLAAGDTARARASLERGLAMRSRARIDDAAKERARAALNQLQ